MLRVFEGLVVAVFAVVDHGAEADGGRRAQMLSELQREQESSRAPVAVVERVDVFEREMAHRRADQRGHVPVAGKSNPLREQDLDFRFRGDAGVDPFAGGWVVDVDGSVAEQFAVRLVLLGEFA